MCHQPCSWTFLPYQAATGESKGTRNMIYLKFERYFGSQSCKLCLHSNIQLVSYNCLSMYMGMSKCLVEVDSIAGVVGSKWQITVSARWLPVESIVK